MNDQNNFSDIPSLGDTEGLDNYLQNQALQSQGLTPVEDNTQTSNNPVSNVPNENSQQLPTGSYNTQHEDFSKNDIQNILRQIDSINAKLNNQNAQYRAPVAQPNTAPQAAYSATERAFITDALNKGYSIEQINSVILKNRNNAAGYNNNSQIEQRMAALEQYLQTQEYKAAESAFITKISDFGNKWGLSEQDLVTFGNAALNKGINIAMANVDLDTVFKAIYPEQYSIRSQRMQPTHTSQIYGGTSVPEGTRRTAAKAEDMYVESFLKSAMPNQYGVKK